MIYVVQWDRTGGWIHRSVATNNVVLYPRSLLEGPSLTVTKVRDILRNHED